MSVKFSGVCEACNRLHEWEEPGPVPLGLADGTVYADDPCPQCNREVRGTSIAVEVLIATNEETSPFAAAVRTEIVRLTDGPNFRLAQMQRLRLFVEHALPAMQAIENPDVASVLGRRRMEPFGLAQLSPGFGSGGFGEITGIGELPGTENYGTKMLREMVDAVKPRKKPRDPEALVRAIVYAREEGLTDIADALRKELLDASSQDEPSVDLHDEARHNPSLVAGTEPMEVAS
jgi:hypothetical protein